ncbi:hypothetical protein BRADI_2g35723v3 [Brachypodium distachyon]|uniref:Uncharacterized protein n=1 Tax=Brachypodium distachyon TaxID=15368 RepID=A0A2K2DC01_BRADI|nr:hypothetical protein BRADI_2g35723v3 [Brachypodium distachyon]
MQRSPTHPTIFRNAQNCFFWERQSHRSPWTSSDYPTSPAPDPITLTLPGIAAQPATTLCRKQSCFSLCIYRVPPGRSRSPGGQRSRPYDFFEFVLSDSEVQGVCGPGNHYEDWLPHDPTVAERTVIGISSDEE